MVLKNVNVATQLSIDNCVMYIVFKNVTVHEAKNGSEIKLEKIIKKMARYSDFPCLKVDPVS